MSIARKCDRCGALVSSEVKSYPKPLIKIVDEFSATNQRAFMELDDLDLCTACNKSFFNWLDEGKRKQDVDDSKMFLKKCPFCGDADATLQKFYETCDGIGEKYPKITCNKCGASITLTNNEIKNIDTVHNYKGGYHSACEGLLEKYNSVLVAKWNRRTTND